MSKYKYDINVYDLRKKDINTRDMVEYMLERTQSMFKWNNLPDNIPQRSLELMLQTNGFVVFAKHNDEICIYTGGLGGEPDYLYRPTICTIANPAQNFDAELKVVWDKATMEGGECVICMNDTLLKGLLPLNRKYASQLSENELSIWLSDILTRSPWLLSAQDDKTRQSAEKFIENIFEGKLSTVVDSAFLDGVKEHILTGNSQGQTLGALLQLHQYYISKWYNELGLNALQNGMKKEAISDSEENMNSDVLKPLISTMLELRKEFCELANEFFDLDISVELDSSWKDNEEELQQELAENEIEETQDEETTEEETLNDENSEELDENAEELTDEEKVDKSINETIEEIKEEVEEILDEVKEDEANE